MNNVQYIKLIKEQINNRAERVSGLDYIFQQDNASVHTSRLVQSYLNENNIYIFCRGLHAPRTLISLKIARQNLFTAYTRMESSINKYKN